LVGLCSTQGVQQRAEGGELFVRQIIWRAPDGSWSHQDPMTRRDLDFDAAVARWGAQLATISAAGAPT
jgi:hypothetical protein